MPIVLVWRYHSGESLLPQGAVLGRVRQHAAGGACLIAQTGNVICEAFHTFGDSGMIVVYQMGKVGSVSICEGLKQRGLDARHHHVLGRDAVLESLSGILSPNLSNPCDQDLNSVFNNIRTTQDLLRCRKTGQKVKIITLARNPRDRWPSDFIQNFDAYYRRLVPCLLENGAPPDDVPEALKLFLELVFDRLDSVSASFDDPAFHEEIKDQAGFRAYPAISAQCKLIVWPLIWFDKHLRPVTGIDIYPEKFDRPFRVYENEFCEVLLLKFEALKDMEDEIGRFVGLPDFRLPVHNVSAAKERAKVVRRAWQSVSVPEGVEAKIRASKYCRHFGY